MFTGYFYFENAYTMASHTYNLVYNGDFAGDITFLSFNQYI